MVVADREAFGYYESSKEVIFTIASSTDWIGLLNSIQEITKESVIYKRETVNLKLFPYDVQAIRLRIDGFLTIHDFVLIFMQILFTGYGINGIFTLEIMLSFLLTVFASTAFGLVISTMVSNSDRAMGYPIVLIPRLIFNGLVFKLEGISEWLSI